MNEEKKYLCKFDAAGIRGETYIAAEYDDAAQADMVTKGYTYVSEDDYAYYVGNRGQGANSTGYVRDSTTGKPVSAPAYVPTKDEKAAAISSEYSAQIAELKDALATATLAGDADLIASLKSDYTTTMAAYQAALKGAE